MLFNSIQFISCSVDPKGVLTHRIENMSVYKYTSMYKLSKVSKKYPIISRFNILGVWIKIGCLCPVAILLLILNVLVLTSHS
jgi:hypothetical protein